MNEHQKLLAIYAEYFNSLGLNIAPISNKFNKHNFQNPNIIKGPAISLEQHLKTPQKSVEVQNYNWHESVGLGLVVGYDHLIAIDIDGCIELDFVHKICSILEINGDYEWIMKSGSGTGFHLVFKCPDLIFEYDFISNIDENLNKNNVRAFPSVPHFNLSRKELKYVKKVKYNATSINSVTSIRENYDKSFYGLIDNREAHFLTTIFDKLEIIKKGFLVLPPSSHISGSTYKFINGFPKNKPQIIEADRIKSLVLRTCSKEMRLGSIDWEPKGYFRAHQFDSNTEIKYIVFDVETDGLPTRFPLDDRYSSRQPIQGDYESIPINNMPDILQISWMFLNSDFVTLRTKSALFKVGDKQLNEASCNVHGLNNQILNTLGDNPKDVLVEFINDVSSSKAILVAHNMDFDLSVLKASLSKYGINQRLIDTTQTYCTMREYVQWVKSKPNFSGEFVKFPKLEELYFELFGDVLPTEHNAIYDALVCKKCFHKLESLKDDDILI